MNKNKFLHGSSRFTENGAVSNPTTGHTVLDYFSKSGAYRDRKQTDVDADLNRMWAESPRLTLSVMFYNRLITRRVSGRYATEKVQKGQGARDEFRKGLVWLARYHPTVLFANLWLIPVVGRWADLWHDDLIEVLQPRDAIFSLIKENMGYRSERELIAKYLPRPRSLSKTFTKSHELRNRWVSDFRRFMGWTAAEYRKFKSSPENQAHAFQRALCGRAYHNINFDRISGRALRTLVGHRGRDGKTTLERHKMTQRYMRWLELQPVAPFTGYPYELYRAAATGGRTAVQAMTYDRQFNGLVARAKADRGCRREKVWCALDTSGSMARPLAQGLRAIDVCVGLGLYFSALNDGAFANSVVMFDNTSRLLKLSGRFCQRVDQIRGSATAMGSTNFQSVIELMCQVRRTRPKIPTEDFPTTLLVVSDMQFNPVKGNVQTNYQAAVSKLRAVGLPRIKIIWWDVTGYGQDFPSTIADEGVTLMSGFDGAVLELLLGRQEELSQRVEGRVPTPYEQMVLALDQEILRKLVI